MTSERAATDYSVVHLDTNFLVRSSDVGSEQERLATANLADFERLVPLGLRLTD